MQIALLTAPEFLMSEEIVAILDFNLQSSTLPIIQFIIYFLTSIGELKTLSSSSSTPQTLARSPCGFESVSSAVRQQHKYLIRNNQGQLC